MNVALAFLLGTGGRLFCLRGRCSFRGDVQHPWVVVIGSAVWPTDMDLGGVDAENLAVLELFVERVVDDVADTEARDETMGLRIGLARISARGRESKPPGRARIERTEFRHSRMTRSGHKSLLSL